MRSASTPPASRAATAILLADVAVDTADNWSRTGPDFAGIGANHTGSPAEGLTFTASVGLSIRNLLSHPWGAVQLKTTVGNAGNTENSQVDCTP